MEDGAGERVLRTRSVVINPATPEGVPGVFYGPRRWHRRVYPYLLLAPAFLALGTIFAYPLFFALLSSLQEWNLLRPAAVRRFVWLKNYSALLTDLQFGRSLWVTLIYVGAEVSTSLLIGTCLALCVHQQMRFRRLIQGLLTVPYLLPGIVAATTFLWLYNPEFGFLNYLLRLVELPARAWLGDPRTALWAIVACGAWWGSAFAFLIVLAGLEALPGDVYEAARIDGATGSRLLLHITLPLLRPVLLVVTMLRIMQAFQMIVNVLVLTGGSGGPGDSTLVLTLFLWKTGFQYFDMGRASALAILMVIFSVAMASGLQLIVRRYGEA